jgi:hypothetical protein
MRGRRGVCTNPTSPSWLRRTSASAPVGVVGVDIACEFDVSPPCESEWVSDHAVMTAKYHKSPKEKVCRNQTSSERVDR